MAKKTYEQLQADKEKLRQQLEEIESQQASIAGEEADAQRKLVDDALSKYNGLAQAAGKPTLFLAPHTGGKGTRGPRGPRKAGGNDDVPADALNKAMKVLQDAKGKPVDTNTLGKAAGYGKLMQLLATEMAEGRVKAAGEGRKKQYSYIGK